jgi:hypothetical protein
MGRKNTFKRLAEDSAVIERGEGAVYFFAKPILWFPENLLILVLFIGVIAALGSSIGGVAGAVIGIPLVLGVIGYVFLDHLWESFGQTELVIAQNTLEITNTLFGTGRTKVFSLMLIGGFTVRNHNGLLYKSLGRITAKISAKTRARMVPFGSVVLMHQGQQTVLFEELPKDDAEELAGHLNLFIQENGACLSEPRIRKDGQNRLEVHVDGISMSRTDRSGRR